MRIMGVDLGIRKIALATWDDDMTGEMLLTGTDAHASSAGNRQTQLMDCADFLYETVHYTFPDLLVIEEPLLGNNRKYSLQLAQMFGACLLRCAELQGEQGSLDVISVNVKAWKKAVLGNGNASKDMVRDSLIQRNSAYADLCGFDQDRFDAACIGYYGLILHNRAVAISG